MHLESRITGKLQFNITGTDLQRQRITSRDNSLGSGRKPGMFVEKR
jgi:hypothetical protein